MAIYDINGSQISGGGTSDFSVTDYKSFTDNSDSPARQGVLTYQGKKFYPTNFEEQRHDIIKKYDGGIMLTLGDSYTAYMNTLFTSFAEKHGLVQDNRGLASSTIAGSEDGTTVGYHAFWVRLNEAIQEYTGGHQIGDITYHLEDVKLIHFMGGANDWSTVNGEINRLGTGPQETNPETLYGACNYIFGKFLSEFPNADIIVTLQPVNYANTVPTEEDGAKNVGFDSLEQAKRMTDAQYSSYLMMRKEVIVREMAERYGLTICDCCFDWYNPINPDEAAKYWQSDKLHLTADGHQAIIDELEKVVNNMRTRG